MSWEQLTLVIIALTAYATIEIFGAWSVHRSTRRARGETPSGGERMLGARGTAVVDCAPMGRVRVGLETWNAICEGEGRIARGDLVRVRKVDGNRLVVETWQ